MSHLILTAVGGDLGETVSLSNDSVPAPTGDDLLIAVEAAPVNHADVLFAAGWFGVYPDVPAALGAEGVGRVIEAGPQADRSLLGRRVLILPTFAHGTWADRVVVPARQVVPVGDSADALQLAMLPVNPATAHALLNDYVTLRPGDWIGLNLANSAVGQYVIALAKRAGVRTLAIVRREKAAAQVRELGADAVVLDGDGLEDRLAKALGDHRLRLFLEGTGSSDQVAAVAGSVETGGSVVAFSSATGQSPALPLPDLIYRGLSLRSFFILNWIATTPRQELEKIYGELAELVEQGVLRVAVEATYPLHQHHEALAHAQRPGRSGKILFTPGQSQAQ
ncbi:trans-2-enoyl-CoA reductase [Nonomuraea terrae]|uniref:enoyl-[acyl-carrier-protein] reductase n=1 Tax=Nonomuraea terrae TaxID=2530383 RepID=A0A4R4Y0I4_9ACTN|nr:zinc-dependent alcohol dehydrogenase family protein [Nonomuraea terrae]TDD37503.1 trans-2-enoyl-CoA reductase [Nonomuraea terrae]